MTDLDGGCNRLVWGSQRCAAYSHFEEVAAIARHLVVQSA